MYLWLISVINSDLVFIQLVIDYFLILEENAHSFLINHSSFTAIWENWHSTLNPAIEKKAQEPILEVTRTLQLKPYFLTKNQTRLQQWQHSILVTRTSRREMWYAEVTKVNKTNHHLWRLTFCLSLWPVLMNRLLCVSVNLMSHANSVVPLVNTSHDLWKTISYNEWGDSLLFQSCSCKNNKTFPALLVNYFKWNYK